jgi:hypothetical protein
VSLALPFSHFDFSSLSGLGRPRGRGEIFVPLKSIPAHGRASVFLTATGGGLADGVSQVILAHLIPPGDTIEVELDGAGRVFDRSRPDAMSTPLAKPATTDWQQRKATLSRFFTRPLGFDDIVRVNILDGVRVYFKNGGRRAHPVVGQRASAAHLCQQRFASARR